MILSWTKFNHERSAGPNKVGILNMHGDDKWSNSLDSLPLPYYRRWPRDARVCLQVTCSVITAHKSIYQAVKSGDYSEAQQELPDYAAGDILDNFERGRINLLDQKYPESKSSFEAADQAVTEQQRKAVISISDSATSVGALAVNDNITEYVPPDYELGFLHLYLGLNYLKKNDLEGAVIEMRRANQVQEQAKKQREAELERAASDAGVICQCWQYSCELPRCG